jgi:hypothetical protein
VIPAPSRRLAGGRPFASREFARIAAAPWSLSADSHGSQGSEH